MRKAQPGISMKMIARLVSVTTLLSLSSMTLVSAQETPREPEVGSAIFIHPDGSGVAAWGAVRLLVAGPDGKLNWDRMEHMGVYKGHMRTSMGATSHGGATSHAFGVKVHWDSYGMDGTEPLTSLSGKPYGILREAHEAGLATALVNSGHIAEPGTGVFAASSPARAATDTITLQIVESGTDFILSGGEILLLPEGVIGKFGLPGVRNDGLNLIERAEELGYQVVYTRDELMALPAETEKVLGVFAAGHTFLDRSEEYLRENNLSLYSYWVPSVAEMTEAVLGFLEATGKRFLLVVEEEGSDNFANNNNAVGSLTALSRADEAIGVALEYLDRNPRTLVVTAADSDAGGLEVYPIRDPDFLVAETPLPVTARNGAPLDGKDGTATAPFMSEPDQFGNQWPFGIAWASFDDNLGGILARATGLNASLLPNPVDNTDIYRLMYATLFGVWLEPKP
jgi:alkaline phosphatase